MWFDLPKSSIALRTDEWIQLIDNESVNEPIQSNLKQEIINIDALDNQQQTFDVTQTVDNTAAENFDLLSYLCDVSIIIIAIFVPFLTSINLMLHDSN